MVIGTIRLDVADAAGGAAGAAAPASAGFSQVQSTTGAAPNGPTRIRASFNVTPYLLAAGKGAPLSASAASTTTNTTTTPVTPPA